MNGLSLEDNQINYTELFNNYLNRTDVTSRVQELLNSNKTRLPINLDHLRQYYPDAVPTLLSRPIPCIRILENGLQEIVDTLNNDSSNNKKRQQGNVMNKRPHYTLGFEGTFGKNHVTPRGLNANSIHNLVAVNGIVTRMSIVRPKLMQSVHYCDSTKVGLVKDYYDQYNIVADKTLQNETNAFPKRDKDDNPLTTEYGFCRYKDHQVLLVQEMPERAPTGMMPHSVEVVLEDDLVDKVKPGDRIQVVGVYKAIVGANTSLSAMFKGVLIATNVHVLSTEIDAPTVTPEEIHNIRKVSKRDDIFELLSRSVAPSIYGHDSVKKAILLMLLGGVEKVLESKTHLRGDINILMIGDPSTAKSQLLRRVLSIAPLAINTTGRGSSGVGLTAAVTFDKDTGEKHLEAGAMVLADKGIVCIDEFDKMEEADRVAIHEVMEQQTVTIAKAGIHTTLNARCSVVAAANPIYGEYQRDLSIGRNIGLPDSLLSRFDFIFVVLDAKDSGLDRMIAQRVTRNHRYQAPGHEDNFAGMYDQDDDYYIEPEINERVETDMFEKYNAVIHDEDQGQLLSIPFLKKYIYYAKRIISPSLKDEAVEFISNAWSRLRQQESEEKSSGPKSMPITIRTLETLIRISTAHAKMRLSREVEVFDCEKALELLNHALKGGDEKEDDDDEDGQARDDQGGDEGEMTIATSKEEAAQNDRRKDSNKRVTRSNAEKRPAEPEITKSKETTVRQGFQKTQKTADKTREGKTSEPEAKDLTKKMKKVSLEERDEKDAEDYLEKVAPMDIEVTEEAIKYVFKEFNALLKGRQQLPEAELWSEINKKVGAENERVRRSLEKREGMKRVLEALDGRNSLMYDKDQKLVIFL